jgi:molecular chaperone HscA
MLIEARMEAKTLLHHVGRALDQGRSLIGDEERKRILDAMDTLKRHMEGEDHRLILQTKDRLDAETRHLAEVLMDSTLQEAVQGRKLSDLPE